MSTVAKRENEKSFEPVSEGLHPAICYMIVDLGKQYSMKYDRDRYQAYIGFEVLDETVKVEGVDKPMVIGNTYTLSLGDKATLRKVLEGWRGKKFTEEELNGFDIKNVLGVPCQIQVLHNQSGEKVYANISNIVPYPKGIAAPKATSELIHYDMDAADRDAMFAKLPEWLQKKVKESKSYIEDTTGLFSDFEPLNDEQMPF
jgi:hypothetical protein